MQHLLVFFAFLLGYVLGRLDCLIKEVKGIDGDPSRISMQKGLESKKKREISIDESKVVVDISTEGLESREDGVVGVITQTTDDIGSAANKLAQLKKAKG